MGEVRAPSSRYAYEKDGRTIYVDSFATIRAETPGLSAMDPGLATVVTRMIHAAGDVGLIHEVQAHPELVQAAKMALRQGKPILTDSKMLANGVTRRRLPAGNDVICTLRDPRVPELAHTFGTTRSAAAVSLWEEHLAGAVVAIGNAPTALFHLLEMLHDGSPRPAAILGIPVGFVGADESKQALAEHRLEDGVQIPSLIVQGRRGGSAIAAAAVNALSTDDELA